MKRASATGGAFHETLEAVTRALDGPLRADVVAALSRESSGRSALERLRDMMRGHTWRAGTERSDLGPAVRALDRETRAEGFHALHDWDGAALAVSAEIIPVDVVNLASESRGGTKPDEAMLAILLDYYFLYVLALLSLRVWDTGGADDNFDRLTRALDALQGPHGSSQRFADDAETLMLIATSHYEADERGYDRLLHQVRTLDRERQVRIAIAHAASMGCHLRFGFEATYGRDMGRMRDDNVADYPWLSYALVTLAREYARRAGEGTPLGPDSPIVEALLNGMSADPEGFAGAASIRVPVADTERHEMRDLVLAHRSGLADRFDALRPSTAAYSPLSFFFNFCQNVLKGAVLDAALWGAPSQVSLNDLVSGLPREDAPDLDRNRQAVARTLMRYAQANPHRIRGQLMPVIVYDPEAGRRAFAATMRALRQAP